MKFEDVSNILQREYLYDSMADFLPVLPTNVVPTNRGDCLDLSGAYANLVKQFLPDEFCVPCLSSRVGSELKSHVLNVNFSDRELLWLTDVAGSVLTPIYRQKYPSKIIESLDGNWIFYNADAAWVIQPSDILVLENDILQERTRFNNNCTVCHLNPILSTNIPYPFSVHISRSSFSIYERGSKVFASTFVNGVDDKTFERLTIIFFANLKNYYGDNNPFSSEDEFLQEVHAFLEYQK